MPIEEELKMAKNFLIRFVNSFMYAIGITTVIYSLVFLLFAKPPLLPEFANRFHNEVEAVLVQLILIGFMSAALGGGTVIMEIERMSLLAQTVIYYVLSLIIWLWVGNTCWCIFKYPMALASVMTSYTVSYIICWVIQFRLCRKNITEINKRLAEMQEENE